MAASGASGSAIDSDRHYGANQQSQAPYNQLKVVTVDKRFLTSNRSSHTSAFSAIAELVDNAKDAKANLCGIQITFALDEGGGPTFIMMDTGEGMSPRNLERSFGFGHNIKSADDRDQMIGWAGNGLKSSSMYLGKDLIVFTKTTKTQSIGLLSQTFLEETGMSEVRLPLVSWDLKGNPLQASEAQTEQNMEAIIRFSPYEDNDQCLCQLDAIENTGTIIVIMNLEGYQDKRYQLDWKTDERDILIPDTENAEARSSAPRAVHNSLRKFLALLYQNPKMQILINGYRVHIL